MKKKFLLFACFPFAFFCASNAQDDEISPLHYGLVAGPVYSSVSDLETTILSEPYFMNYSLKAGSRLGWTTGAFLNYRFAKSLALYTDILYARQGSDLRFDNINDFNYKMEFRYQYINITGMMKFYPMGAFNGAWNGLNVGVGPQLGLNIAPQNIVYTSWGAGKREEFGSDLQQQQQLRNVLKGKTNFGFDLAVGYEFPKFGLTMAARYFLGVTDAVETQANSYNFIENKNTPSSIQFTVGWDFSYFNTEGL